jgi:transposase-like protein
MKSSRHARRFSAEQKAIILRRHLEGKVPISDLCDEYQVSPASLYNWQRKLMDNLGAALEAVSGPKKAPREMVLERKVASLQAKVAKKDQVIAEISEEYVTLKKELGEP